MGKTSCRAWRILAIIFVDTLLIGLADILTIFVQHDFLRKDLLSIVYSHRLFVCFWTQLMVSIAVFLFRRMYQYIWKTVSLCDVVNMCVSVLIAQGISWLYCNLVKANLPLSTWFLMSVFQIGLLVGARCAVRFWTVFHLRLSSDLQKSQRIMLIGAGEMGQLFSRELKNSRLITGKLYCIIDDDVKKHGKYLYGVPIVGGRDDIQSAVKNYGITNIVLAISTLDQKERAEIIRICQTTKCKLQVLPEIYQFLNAENLFLQNQEIEMDNLLGRTPIHLDEERVSEFLQAKTVLVTGGGGSIGSELCRQIAKYSPKCLIALDIYENNVYDVQQELQRIYGNKLNFHVEIASIREKTRIYQIFEKYRPDVVFHAAAHKHVPLMEHCPAEAIKNNVFGTYHVVRAAEKYGAKKFVMISTDKAVNPTNFMGATKRFCEMILQSRKESVTEFCAVRFGNVLGSNGSVVPLFKRQIENGGPVTITDKRIVRYFMTITEAVMLVLEAGAMARQSEIFILDMGKPVKILTLAENLIRMSGLEPYRDIEIKEIGLRPGEKLYEELLMSSEGCTKTSNRKIFIEKQQVISQEEIMCGLVSLDNFITAECSNEELMELMKQMVPTFCDPQEVNRKAETVQCK